MGKTEQFYKNLEKGKKGEQIIIETLSKITEVRDLSSYEENKFLQKKGLDFEFKNRDTGEFDRADAKSNITEKGFHFVELHKGTGELGWLNKTKSDWIFCYDSYNNNIYYYEVNQMKKYVDDRIRNNSIKVHTLKDGCIGVWLPVEHISIIKQLIVN